MKILSIGNSFSQDATRYLHRLAASNGDNIKTVNLYIGGCPLRLHYFNVLEDRRSYFMEFNGENTAFQVSIKDALMSDEWDYVTLQQVSGNAPRYSTYQPYLDTVAAYVRKYAPQAKILMHQTWAYEDGSERLTVKFHYEKSIDMLNEIIPSYKKAAEAIGAVGIIPSGQAMMRLHENGIEKVHRDSFHASFGLGRYTLALTWYGYLTGKDVSEVPFSALDEAATEEEFAIAKRSVAEVLAETGTLR